MPDILCNENSVVLQYFTTITWFYCIANLGNVLQLTIGICWGMIAGARGICGAALFTLYLAESRSTIYQIASLPSLPYTASSPLNG